MLERTAEEHARLVAELQAEYFADDLTPPEESQRWGYKVLHKWFENGGGDITPPSAATPRGGTAATASTITPAASRTAGKQASKYEPHPMGSTRR